MNYSLCLQSTYQNVEVALCNEQTIIQTISLPNAACSATLIVQIDTLLKNHTLSLSDCNYIAVNQGPGPFSTLRSILATVQGIAFGTKIPLIGIDGLKGLIAQYHSADHPYTIALLNAFNNELYYAIASETECSTGYANATKVQNIITETIGNHSALVIGNGIPFVLNNPTEVFDSTAIIFNSAVLHCSIEDIAKLGFAGWQNNQKTQESLMPLYLKKHAVERL